MANILFEVKWQSRKYCIPDDVRESLLCDQFYNQVKTMQTEPAREWDVSETAFLQLHHSTGF